MNTFDYKLLQEISLPCYDDGKNIIDRSRLDKIEKIATGSDYTYKVSAPLFTLFSRKPVDAFDDGIVILSTHVDAVKEITRFYVKEIDENTIHGTLDNTATNAIALSLMLNSSLEERVLIAFTANEEKESLGATQLIEYLKPLNKKIFVIVLDVTYEGYDSALFTIENNFFNAEYIHETIKQVILSGNLPFRFIPESYINLPEYIKFSHLERYSDGGIIEALPDESWNYHELGIECFSLCLPTQGEMHDNCGVDCKRESFAIYKDMVRDFANCIACALNKK